MDHQLESRADTLFWLKTMNTHYSYETPRPNTIAASGKWPV